MAIPFEPIALSYRQFDPLSSLAKSQQLQAAQQDLQMQQMKLGEMQRQIQEANAQRQAGSYAATYAPQQTVSSPSLTLGGMELPNITPQSAVQGPAGADFRNQYISKLGQLGQGQMIPGAQNEFAMQDAAKAKLMAEQQQAAATLDKTKADTGKANTETMMKHIDLVGSTAQSLLQMPDEQAAALYPHAVQLLKAQGIDVSMFPQQWDRAAAQQEAQMAVSAKDQLAQKMQQERDAANEKHQQNQEALTKRGQDITVRGQNMTENRAAKTAMGADLTPEQLALVDEIGQGKMPLTRMDYMLSRNPNLAAAVAAKYPDFDGSKIASYKQATRDFTGSGKIGVQLNAGSTAMRHFSRLKDINDNNPTTVRVPGTAAYKEYNNLLDTVAGEVLTFYGTPKTNETIASVKGTLGGLTNRDAAITEQALAMGAKFDEIENTWQNAAPSKAYQAPMPGYSEAAKQARAKLDPEYAKRLQSNPSPSRNPQSSGGDPFAQFGGVKH